MAKLFASTDFWVLVSFSGFIALLVYLKVPQLATRALDKRSARIAAELDEARRLREEAETLLADYRRKAREAEAEAEAIVTAATRDARALAEAAKANLEQTLARRLRAAEERIARAESDAVAEVRARAIDAAVGAARDVLRERLSGEDSAPLVRRSIAELKAQVN